MTSKNILILAALGLAAYFILGTGGGGSLVPSAGNIPASGSAISDEQKKGIIQTVGGEITNAQVMTNAMGVVVQGSATYKGKNRITSEEAVYNIMAREGVNTPVYATNNPLELVYDKSVQITGTLPTGIKYVAPASANTFISARSPASQTEANAARAANLRSLISSGAKDPATLNASSRALLGMN